MKKKKLTIKNHRMHLLNITVTAPAPSTLLLTCFTVELKLLTRNHNTVAPRQSVKRNTAM